MDPGLSNSKSIGIKEDIIIKLISVKSRLNSMNLSFSREHHTHQSLLIAHPKKTNMYGWARISMNINIIAPTDLERGEQ